MMTRALANTSIAAGLVLMAMGGWLQVQMAAPERAADLSHPIRLAADR